MIRGRGHCYEDVAEVHVENFGCFLILSDRFREGLKTQPETSRTLHLHLSVKERRRRLDVFERVMAGGKMGQEMGGRKIGSSIVWGRAEGANWVWTR